MIARRRIAKLKVSSNGVGIVKEQLMETKVHFGIVLHFP